MEKINLKDYGITLHLVRHGEDDRDKLGGWSENHLTAKGIKEIEALVGELDDDYDLFVSSDLIRTKETSAILNTKLKMDIVYDSGFREKNNGIYKNMLRVDAKRLGVKPFKELEMDEAYPEGESPNLFYIRIKEAFLKLINENRNKKILLVSHGGVITIILCLIKGIQYSNKLNLKPETGSITKLN